MKIAIDGPAGSGKSTVAKFVAQKLNLMHINTGLFYRWLTYNALEEGLDHTQTTEITQLAKRLDYTAIPEEKVTTGRISGLVAKFAAIPEVREVVADKQREVARDHNVIMEGRDIGTVVFPDAEVKIFLTANLAERAKRKQLELAAKGETNTLEEIEEKVKSRDEADIHREVSPLRQADDAIEVDTSKLTIDEVVAQIIKFISSKVLIK